MGRKAIDVLRAVCDQIGWDQIVTLENEETLTKDDRKLVRALNRTLRVLSGVQDWRFLRAEGEIITIDEYTTGRVRLTNGSTTVTGVDDPDITGTLLPTWTTAMVGRALIVVGNPLPYLITAVNSATSLTINRAWQGDTTLGTTDAPDLNYRIMQDRYELPQDFDRPVDEKWSLFKDTVVLPITVVDPMEIRARRMANAPSVANDDPNVVALWAMDDEVEHRVAILDPFPHDQRVITFEYQRIHPTIDRDTQRILFPPRYEEIVLDGVEFLLKEGPDDDARSDKALSEFLRTRAEGAAARETGQRRLRLSPSQWRAYDQRSKWGRNGARINWGSAFDRIDFYDLG